MKVFTCNDFHGRYPVGASAVVVADSAEEAEIALLHQLNLIGLTQEQKITLVELDTSKRNVVILDDGDY